MEKSEKFWDKSAPGYDKEEMKDKEVRMKILSGTRQYLKKQDAVLDFGCATGILANEIAGDVYVVQGIDISAEMIRIAQRNAQARSIRNVSYSQSSLFDEQFKPGSFDVVLGIYLLHLLDDMPGALKRIYTLLKPGGLFISVTPCFGKKSVTGFALSLLSKTGMIPALSLLGVDDLQGAMTAAGFRIAVSECLQQRGRQYFIVAKKSS